MKIKHLILTLLFTPLLGFGQTITVTGTSSSVTLYRGGILCDSILKVPVRWFNPLYPFVQDISNIQIYKKDSTFWYHNGTAWIRVMDTLNDQITEGPGILYNPIGREVSFNFVVPTTIDEGTRNFNQAYQISATRPSEITVSPRITCTLSLTTGQSGTVVLEISPNGTTGWISMATWAAENTGTLVVGSNITHIAGSPSPMIKLPAGYYWRLTTSNVTGTPTYFFNGGAYIIY